MIGLNAYLHFNGNTREAMLFYQDCFGGELYLQTISETPIAGQMPEKNQHQIVHASLIKENMTIFASDMVGIHGIIYGNAISLCINCSSLDEINKLYKHLVKDGRPEHELSEAFWGSTFGDLTDKFGINWMLIYENN